MPRTITFEGSTGANFNAGTCWGCAICGSLMTGTGDGMAPNGTGNTDIYVGPDHVHPTDAGHTFLAARYADGIIAAISK